MQFGDKREEKMKLSELRAQANLLEPVIRIGKKGLNENIFREIAKHLRKKKIIKIKFLKSSFSNDEKESMVRQIESRTNSKALTQIGNTVTICTIYKDKFLNEKNKERR